ncbi:hypothetical protein ACFWJE_13355 [Streptomyces griseoincarnatus]
MNDQNAAQLSGLAERRRLVEEERGLLDRALAKAADLMDTTPGHLVLDDAVREEARARLSMDSVREQHRPWLEANLLQAAARRSLRGRMAVRVTLGALSLLTVVAGGVYTGIAAKDAVVLPLYNREYVLFAITVGVLSVLLAVVAVVWKLPVRVVAQQAAARLGHAEDRLFLALRAEAESVLSSVLNERWALSKGEIAVLESLDAPILVELETVKSVPSTSLREVFDFIEEHRTSAIGISGTRGIGKTTLMRAVQSMDPANYIGVYLPVPVHYAAPEFFRTLFREVATSILKSNSEGMEYLARQNRVVRQGIELARFAVGGFFVLGGAVLISYARSAGSFPVKPMDVPGLLLILMGLGIMVVTALSSSVVHRAIRESLGPTYVQQDVSLAAQILQNLDYSATHQKLSKNVLAMKILTVEDQDQLELAERELTHPELVLKFRDFISTFVRTSPREIIIALDELDKMEDGEDALAFVNSIKDLLHIQGVHFLVSVSEDALHNFSLRGVPLRDVFDSSFDSIIPVQRFTIEESTHLLQSRVVGFPECLALFCHAMSGGVPRDLIRVARQCVGVRRVGEAAVPVDKVVWSILSRQAVLVCEALAAKMQQEQQRVPARFLEAVLDLKTVRDLASLTAAVDEVARRIRGCVQEDYPLAGNAAAYLSCLSTLGAYFGVSRTNEEWEREKALRVSPRVAESVAGALELIRFESDTAASVLDSLRAELGFPRQDFLPTGNQ